jgi:hypothetical protein
MGINESVFFGRYRSVFLRRKTRSAHFGIKKGAEAPFFPKRGAPPPFWKKEGRKGGRDTKKGGAIPTENTGRANLIPGKYR